MASVATTRAFSRENVCRAGREPPPSASQTAHRRLDHGSTPTTGDYLPTSHSHSDHSRPFLGCGRDRDHRVVRSCSVRNTTQIMADPMSTNNKYRQGQTMPLSGTPTSFRVDERKSLERERGCRHPNIYEHAVEEHHRGREPDSTSPRFGRRS